VLDTAPTDEHVRRICELAYADAFERVFREKQGAADRYVSFDPPDAVWCAAQLKAAQVSHPVQKKEASAMPPAPVEMMKAASAGRRKYVPRDPFAHVEATKVAERWVDPLAEVHAIQRDLKEAIRAVETQKLGAEATYEGAMFNLAAQASQACKEGYDVGLVLHACASGLDDTAMPKAASHVLHDLACALIARGYDGHGKVASQPEVNPDHPLPRLFADATSIRQEREHFTFALDDLQRDLADVTRKIEALYS
jgi:hypothetical protein